MFTELNKLNKQETLNMSMPTLKPTHSSRVSTGVHFFGKLRIISSSYAF